MSITMKETNVPLGEFVEPEYDWSVLEDSEVQKQCRIAARHVFRRNQDNAVALFAEYDDLYQEAQIAAAKLGAEAYLMEPGILRRWLIQRITDKVVRHHRATQPGKMISLEGQAEYLEKLAVDPNLIEDMKEMGLDWPIYQAVVLHFVYRMTQEEIGTKLGVSQQAIALRIKAGLLQIKEHVKGNGND